MILSFRDLELADSDSMRLRRWGVDAMACPSHEAQQRSYDESRLAQADAFILTSQQAAYALPTDNTNRPVLCVGRASAASARQRGYHNVRWGPSDGQGLAQMICQDAGLAKSQLCWLRARSISFDMKSALRDAGIACHQEIVYEMVAKTSLPDTVCDAFQKGQVTGLMALSKAQLGQAQILLHAYELWQFAKHRPLFVVSQAVADMAVAAGWQSVIVARRKRAISVQAAVVCHNKASPLR